MSGKSPSLLDDTFEIIAIDPDGKKFDKGEGPPPPGLPPYSRRQGELKPPHPLLAACS